MCYNLKMLVSIYKNSNSIKVVKLFLALLIFLVPLLYIEHSAQSQDSSGNSTIENLNEDIKGIKDKIKELEAQKDAFEDTIEVLQDSRLSLTREIDILDNRIAQKLIEIETEQAKIDQTTLEIQAIDDEITILEKDIVLKNGQISESGTHDELLIEDGIYADLWKVQIGELAQI